MFKYADPVGRKFLQNTKAKNNFQTAMERAYDSFARSPGSAFTWLEAFDNLNGADQPIVKTVDWRAFPLSVGASDEEIDADRFNLQDEYIEWRVERKAGRVSRITFTTEFPEYFESFAQISAVALKQAVRDAIPAANATNKDLFGTSTGVDALPPLVRANLFRRNLRQNPWNNGQKGILCLTQGANTLQALLRLLADCAVLSDTDPEDICGSLGGACVPNRSSDPRICAEVQRAVRSKLALSIKDPAGVRIGEMMGTWTRNGQEFDINDPATNQGAWTISRNGRRAVLDLTNGVKLGDEAVVTGAQVSRLVKVSADVIAAPETKIPDWARTGGEATSRGPTA